MSETVKNKGGRPHVGATPITVRLPPDDLAKLDLWIANTAPSVSRPEAIRQILHAMIEMLDRDRVEQEERRQREAERAERTAKRKKPGDGSSRT